MLYRWNVPAERSLTIPFWWPVFDWGVAFPIKSSVDVIRVPLILELFLSHSPQSQARKSVIEATDELSPRAPTPDGNATDEMGNPFMICWVPRVVGCRVLLQDRGVSNEGGVNPLRVPSEGYKDDRSNSGLAGVKRRTGRGRIQPNCRFGAVP
jgi:hypothetical protein